MHLYLLANFILLLFHRLKNGRLLQYFSDRVSAFRTGAKFGAKINLETEMVATDAAAA